MKLATLFPECTELMVLDKSALSVSVTPKAEEIKRQALDQSALVGEVSNAEQQAIAVSSQALLDNLIRLTEKSRKQIKQPVIELGRKIDYQADNFIKLVEDERSRVTELIANFQMLELARVRAAEAATRLELESLERKRQEELARAKDLDHIDSIQEKFNEQSAELAAKPVPVTVKAQGQRVEEDWEIEMVNPYLVAKFHPDCVNITLRLTETKATLNQGITMQGIKAKRIVKTTTRAVKTAATIDV